jgi:formylglycine-generating enzyme required for sulfatase activity
MTRMYSASSSKANPRGPVTANFRVVRGGSWFHGSGFCRSASRRWFDPSLRVGLHGFRVVVAEGAD